MVTLLNIRRRAESRIRLGLKIETTFTYARSSVWSQNNLKTSGRIFMYFFALVGTISTMRDEQK